MTVYHTATQEDYDALMVELDGKGYKWRSKRSLLANNPNNWFDYRNWTYVETEPKFLEVSYRTSRKGDNNVIEYKAKISEDNINKPLHYHSNGIDVIGFAEAQFSKEEQKGFYRINAIKYLTRFDKKGTPLQDLEKAQFYLNKLLEGEE